MQPLVAQTVKRAGADFAGVLSAIAVDIQNNKWFTYGSLLVEEARRQNSVRADILDPVAAKLDAWQRAGDRSGSDPCETVPSVRRYMAQLDASPPGGQIDIDDVRQIVEKGLTGPLQDRPGEAKERIVGNVVQTLRQIIGDGPFVGDSATLTEATERFVGTYLAAGTELDSVDSTLATFLALSFCDTSTREDHDLLLSQFNSICWEVRTLVCEMLATRELNSLVTPDEVNDLLPQYVDAFRKEIANPLCPVFKFPLTTNEQTRLRGKLDLHLGQIESPLDDVSLKVKYGGASADLKKEVLRDLSAVLQKLLVDAGVLRTPNYPGVSWRYRSSEEFIITLPGGLYKEDTRAKAIFRAVKYLHLGHRLEQITRQEAEITLSTMKTDRQENTTHDAAR